MRCDPHRAVLRGLGVIVIAGMIGCISPPSLSVDVQDAGIDSPPSIVAVRSSSQELQDGVIANFGFQQVDALNLTLLDTDVQDTLFVRIFVNYDPFNPQGPRSSCQSAAGTSAFRTATCDTTTLCLANEVDSPETLLMRIVVFDRQVLDAGTPAFMAMPAGGESTSRAFLLHCNG